jgi:hypothetical protein
MNKNSNYKKQKLVAMLIVASFCFFSCEKKIISSVQPLPDIVSFSHHIMPIFNAHCNVSGCHSGGSSTGELNLSPGFAYSKLFADGEIDTVNASNSNLYIMVASCQMPKAGNKLSDYDIGLIQKWIRQKAKNN